MSSINLEYTESRNLARKPIIANKFHTCRKRYLLEYSREMRRLNFLANLV